MLRERAGVLAVWIVCLTMALAMALTPRAVAQGFGQGLGPRADVVFEVTQATGDGQSVFVLGNAPELGDNDLRLAVKLSAAAYPTWRATISLPAGRSYTYSYFLRNDGPGQTSQASNGVAHAKGSGS